MRAVPSSPSPTCPSPAPSASCTPAASRDSRGRAPNRRGGCERLRTVAVCRPGGSMRLAALALSFALVACGTTPKPPPADGPPENPTVGITLPEPDAKVLLEQFADIRVLRFRVRGWDALTPKTRVLLYH